MEEFIDEIEVCMFEDGIEALKNSTEAKKVLESFSISDSPVNIVNGKPLYGVMLYFK